MNCGRCGHDIWEHADDVGCRVRVEHGRPVQGGRDLCPCTRWSPSSALPDNEASGSSEPSTRAYRRGFADGDEWAERRLRDAGYGDCASYLRMTRHRPARAADFAPVSASQITDRGEPSESGIASEGFTGHEVQPDGRCKHRWRNRQTKIVTCRFADGWHAGRVAMAAEARAASPKGEPASAQRSGSSEPSTSESTEELIDLVYQLHEDGAIDEAQAGDLCMALGRAVLASPRQDFQPSDAPEVHVTDCPICGKVEHVRAGAER